MEELINNLRGYASWPKQVILTLCISITMSEKWIVIK